MSEIPQFRLPYDVVNFEAELMKDLGVKVMKNISCLCIAQRKKKEQELCQRLTAKCHAH